MNAIRGLRAVDALGVVLSARPQGRTAGAGSAAASRLIAAEFSGPSEGRGYTQARLLREHWNFKGELRATGYVRRDQLFFMARCGFNSFELPDADIEDAHTGILDILERPINPRTMRDCRSSCGACRRIRLPAPADRRDSIVPLARLHHPIAAT